MSFAGILARKGAPVTFTKTTPGTLDESTGRRSPPITVAVDGHAMEIEGEPELYTQLGLIESDNPTLLFGPVVVGVIPTLGMTVLWGGETLTVKNVKRLAMNGTPTAAKIVCSR